MSTTTPTPAAPFVITETDIPDIRVVAGADGVLQWFPTEGWVAYIYGRRVGNRDTAQGAARILVDAQAGVVRPLWAAARLAPLDAIADALDDAGIHYHDEPIGLVIHVLTDTAHGTLALTDEGDGRVMLGVYPDDSWETGDTDGVSFHEDIPAVIVAAVRALTR